MPEGWQTVSDGNLSADFPGLRLIVRRSDSYARYVILKRVGHGVSCAEVMLSSGTEPNVEAAMVAAAKVRRGLELFLPNAAERLLIYRLILEKKARMARGFHVLIVEDEPLVLDVLQTMLETLYHVSSAPTVAEAQAILRTSHIDVALIDSVLPDGRGADVAVLAYNVGAAVIEMTGDPQEHIGLVASGRPHLFKLFRANVLLATVGDALHGHQRSALGTESMAAKTSRREIAALPP